MRNEWYVIQNPVSSGGKSERDWPKMRQLLEEKSLAFEHHYTAYHMHARAIAKDALKAGFRKILVIGGDGTMNEVLNGLMTQNICDISEVTLGIIPVGRGNDWARSMGIRRGYRQAVEVLEREKTIVQDVGLAKCADKERYFMNICGIGFDAYVASKVNLVQRKGKSAGKLTYLANLVRCLMNYSSTMMHIKLKEKAYKEKFFTIAAAINPYNGGGMMQAPNAIPDDGLFDITMIKDVSRGEVLVNVHKLFNGKLLTHPKVSSYRGKYISIASEPNVMVETDGENAGKTPVEITILPDRLRVVTGK